MDSFLALRPSGKNESASVFLNILPSKKGCLRSYCLLGMVAGLCVLPNHTNELFVGVLSDQSYIIGCLYN